jgi:hypothetical protein
MLILVPRAVGFEAFSAVVPSTRWRRNPSVQLPDGALTEMIGSGAGWLPRGGR